MRSDYFFLLYSLNRIPIYKLYPQQSVINSPLHPKESKRLIFSLPVGRKITGVRRELPIAGIIQAFTMQPFAFCDVLYTKPA